MPARPLEKNGPTSIKSHFVPWRSFFSGFLTAGAEGPDPGRMVGQKVVDEISSRSVGAGVPKVVMRVADHQVGFDGTLHHTYFRT